MTSFFLAALILAATTDALVARTQGCCFGLNAVVSGTSSTIGQLSDGQCRVGGGLNPSQFCLDAGKITDGSGRLCVITSPETQFQCDLNSAAAPGFSIGCDGLLSHNGLTTFWECQTGQNGEQNIYTTPGGTACTQITLAVQGGNCIPSCPNPPSPPPPPPPPAPNSCPPNFQSKDVTFQWPHLLVPITSTNPTNSAGTSYFVTITPTTSTLINFDIPPSYAGKTCSLIFLFPAQSQLQTSSFKFSGDGLLSFSNLEGPAAIGASWNSRPATKTVFANVKVAPGAVEGGYVLASFPCPAGQALGFEVGVAEGGNTDLSFFQDYNPSQIGVYIFPC